MDHRKAARVFPEPVGATTRALRPAETASQAPCWAAVGAANEASNHAWVAAENRGAAAASLTGPSSPTGPTSAGRGPPEATGQKPTMPAPQRLATSRFGSPLGSNGAAPVSTSPT